MVIVAYMGGILGHLDGISTTTMGWIILGSIVAITIVRTVLFLFMDTKGV